MPTAPTPHTPLPPAPDISTPATFEALADAFVAAQEPFGDEMDGLAANAYANAVEADADAVATAADRVVVAADKAIVAADKAIVAADKAIVAADKATVQNLAAGLSFTSTSTSDVTIGTGSKTFTVQASESYQPGMPITAVVTGDPTRYVSGIATSYSGTTLQIAVATGGTGGSGSASTWDISISGLVGPQGPAVSLATGSDVRIGTSATVATSPDALYDAVDWVALTDAETITPDFAAGINFTLAIGGNRTLANPTNPKNGQSGLVEITQDGTGSRTLAYGSAWKFPGGAPTLSTAAGTVDAIAYTVKSSTVIRATLLKAFA